jgi:hypothetical protein
LNHPLVRNYATKKRTKNEPKRQYIPPVKQYTKYVAPRRVAVPRYQNVGISEADYTLASVQHLASVKEESVTSKIVTQKVVHKQVIQNDVFSNQKPKKYKNFQNKCLVVSIII